MDIIYLNSMSFRAYHGVHDFEAVSGGDFMVDISLHLDLSSAGDSDRLSDTVDYERVYNIVSEQMSIRSSLIEHVGYRIKNQILETFNGISKVTVKISKLNPPIEGNVHSTAVEIVGVRS
jgi:dihydroneopterin aldolase